MIAGVRLSVLILGVMALLASAPGANGQTAAKEPAVSYPNDGRFLKDRIDFQLVLANQNRPVEISARPGQMTYVSFPVPGHASLIRKYALIMMPESAPRVVAKSYSDLQDAPGEQVTFTLAVFCLEEMPSDAVLGERLEAADSNEVGACKPRQRDIQLFDDVRFLFRHQGLTMKDVHRVASLGLESGKSSSLEGFFESVQVLGYARGKGGHSTELACLTAAGVDVCSCKVSVGSVSSRDFCRE